MLDEDCESQEEMINPLEDIEYSDFRTYPLNINWKDFDSIQNDSYEIKEEYGLIGVNVYFNITNNLILSKALKISLPEKFVFYLIEFYFQNFEKANYEALINLNALINCFPNNDEICSLIKENFVVKKELLLIKVLIDLKLHYLLNIEKLDSISLRSSVNLGRMFYQFISEENLKSIYEKIKQDKNMKNFYKRDKLKNYSKKNVYSSQLRKIINRNKDLLNGLDINKFCL